jgi:hypothetical protein
MTWQQEIDLWLQACQQAGGLHMISGKPDAGKAPRITLVCIPSFPGNPVPDDLRVRLRPDQLFECAQRFAGFPNVMTMIGDGWLYWNAHLSILPQDGWEVARVRSAIRITVHTSLSRQLLIRLLAHEELHEGARCILLGLENGGSVALFDNPQVNAVYAIQKVDSDPALGELRKLVTQLDVQPLEDPRSIVDFELLYWIIQREFSDPLQSV